MAATASCLNNIVQGLQLPFQGHEVDSEQGALATDWRHRHYIYHTSLRMLATIYWMM